MIENTEVDAAGSVPELIAFNPLDTPVLLQRRSPSAGLGEDVRLAGIGVVASGLVLVDELLQLSAFTSNGQAQRTRVARPSRRC